MYPKQLTSHVKPLSAVTPTAGAAGVTAINGSTIDLQGFAGVLFLISIGAIVAGGVQSIKLQHGDESNASDMADVLGSNQAIVDTEDDTVRYLEMAVPTKRYCRVVITRATQNSTFAVVALPYNREDSPFTQTASGESMNNPVSGTA